MAAVYYFLLGFFQLCLAANYYDRTPVVSTMEGDVVGLEGELDGIGYRVFEGIPYADPPVGQLRFSDPIAKSAWEGVFNATSFGRSCPQTKPDVPVFNPEYVVKIPEGGWEIGEDCLTLNVYTPVREGNMTSSGLAVMVWLHGGAYQHGQGSAYDVSALSVKGGVVVVTVNYRLGPLGFLFTGDDSAKGNYGLKDQQMALKWVQNNIMAFGGDPWRVTLFGQSDVLESIPLHLNAEGSRSLFQRMAVHSPTWQSELSDEPNAEGFAGFLNCSNDNSSLMVDCLRSKSLEEIIDANEKVVGAGAEMGSYVWQWHPVLNDDFFITKAKDGIMHDFLSVFNSGDGSIGLDLLKKSLHLKGEPYNLTAGITAEQFNEWLRSYTEDSDVSELVIDNQYIPHDIMDKNFARMKALVDIHLDANSLRYNSERIDELKKQLSSVFMMIFDHRSSVDRKYPELELVPHGEELSYVFGLPFSAPDVGGSFTSDELDLSNRMINFWSNFAKTGDPNSDGTTDQSSNLSQPIWPEYGDSNKYLQIRLNEEEVGSDYRSEEAYFWNEYLPELNEAAREFCPLSESTTKTRTSAEWTPRPTDDKAPRPTTGVTDECDGEVVIGESLGLALSPDQAENLIGSMIFVGVGLLCVIVLVFAVALGYKVRWKGAEQKTEVSVEKGTAPINHYEPTTVKHVNSVYTSDPVVYENVRVPAVHSIEINHKPDQHDDSEDEAEPLQEKHAIPDSDDDEIPPHASVDRSRRPHEVSTEDDDGTGDEEVNFPPPPDDWASKSQEELDQERMDQDEDLDQDTTEDQRRDPSRSEDGSGVSDPPTEPDDEDTNM